MSTEYKSPSPYKAKNKIRVVTAASLFDGHDAAINIMRRILQSSGCEVIHLGHNRSAKEVVDCAIQEDAQAIAMTSYQGGHNEYFKYMYDLLKDAGCSHIKIFGGGGGVILPDEISDLHSYGVEKIYSPDDGRNLGLQGMINDMLEKSDFPTGEKTDYSLENLKNKNYKIIGQLISACENYRDSNQTFINEVSELAEKSKVPVLGITGTGGSGKSSMVDELIRRYLEDFNDKTLGIISVDPSKRKTGGALLGDRIRMNSVYNNRVYMRSLATRQSNLALSKHVKDAINILKASEFDLIILETSGIGQSDTEITEHSDRSLYIMTPEYGASTQLEKIDMLDFADAIAINKFDKRGALDALRDVKKQYQRNHQLWDTDLESLPVFGTIASQFNDSGTTDFYLHIIELLNKNTSFKEISTLKKAPDSHSRTIIPPNKTRYLSEISEAVRNYNQWAIEQAKIADDLWSFENTKKALEKSDKEESSLLSKLDKLSEEIKLDFDGNNLKILKDWDQKKSRYENEQYIFKVRDKEIKIQTHTTSLSHQKIPKVSLPTFKGWGDILKWSLQENVPGEFPYTAGVFPFKREGEDPTRMFAGEGGPERTNRRFHYVSKGLPFTRLSTAFDSVTLYGEDPDNRPDIYGKIGNAGVSICCLDDAKKLYSGFNLSHPNTSVSMTINGPAPMLVGYFMNAAIDQQCEIYIRNNGLESEVQTKIKYYYKEKSLEVPTYSGSLPDGNDGLGLMLLGVTGDTVLPKEVYEKIKVDTLKAVRGTVQADILKEDQAQNTCIFSTEFALKLMGDVQEYFIENEVRKFYSVSISGYHIAEAGANPITQLALTLANGFTYVEYYLARGLDINKFAPNLSFFFSNGIDPEYAVIGRVARRIWAKALKYKYKASNRSQQLKYHIQTSGRSLHAQEIDFNDIRTTLQALYAIYDNCNSLHTNAYDEAVTTPTEDSVRRAMAIQLIINRELGLNKNQNPMQGSFIIEKLTDLVEEAVMIEFDRITERGGVLGAMETMYQRSKIQEESLYYETLKHNGEYPIIGVNTYLSTKGSPTVVPTEVIRAEEEEKINQIKNLNNLHKAKTDQSKIALLELKKNALKKKNLFHYIMDATKYCSLGQISEALYQVGGQYRRNV